MQIPLTMLRRLRERLVALVSSRLVLSAGAWSALPSPTVRCAYAEFNDKGGIDATRYGDWEYTGRCTDF